MENTYQQQQETSQASDYKQLNPVAYSFSSEEDMKAYYLQMFNTMNQFIHSCKISEYMQLHSLRRRLNRYIFVLQLLSRHEWGNGVVEIQNACGVYMLQPNVERKEQLRTNREIGQHLLFLTQLAGNIHITKQILGLMDSHYQNVTYLMNKIKKVTEENNGEKEEQQRKTEANI